MPALSPGSSIPVVLPMPKARMYCSRVSSPTSRASMIVPTLLDLARIPVTVQSIGSWSWASVTVAVAGLDVPVDAQHRVGGGDALLERRRQR